MSSIISEELETKCTLSSNLMWEEIEQAKTDKRHELILSGSIISNRIAKDGLDLNIFKLEHLNYLNISETILENLSEDIGLLKNLTNLVLHTNQLSSLPESVGLLEKLKILDVSRNRLQKLPALDKLDQLMTLNASNNLLISVPCFQKNTKLANIDLSHNKFTEFPMICFPELKNLLELKLNSNQIESIPTEIKNLVSLKHIDLNDNHLGIIPGELIDLHKLKEINLKQNPLKDKRFVKLIDQSRNSKQIFDYIKQHCTRTKDDINKQLKNEAKVEINENLPIIQIIKADSPTYPSNIQVIFDPSVKSIRPFIVCCIIRDIVLTEKKLKAFIQLQTKLHETICEKRQVATIATHDLDRVISLINPDPSKSEIPLYYEGRTPEDLKIKPLGRAKVCSGKQLMQRLHNEAQALRKEKKRNVYSGIHKYLYLIDGKPMYPCITTMASEGGICISFPPITNSEETKITSSTKNIFLEITSSRSESSVRQTADTLLIESLNIFKSSSEEDIEIENKPMITQQIKIVNSLGELRHVYPSRTDLKQNSEHSTKISFNVLRDT